jgi:hypothetical protein
MDQLSEMVERVALALTRRGPGFERAIVPTKICRALARAAIAAMREPTDEMMMEAEIIVPLLACFADKQASPSYKAWQAMIDAALVP